MRTYPTIVDLLNMEGPGLQDYVTADELNQLLDGTLPHGLIADRYMEDLDWTNLVAVETGKTATRADLLTWIGWELEVAAEQRAEDAATNALAGLRAHAAAQARHERLALHSRDALIARAKENGATKDGIAKSLGISRPTLDKWMQEQADRSLFNDAIYTLVRRDTSQQGQEMLLQALGIRDTSAQAHVFLAGLSARALGDLRDGERELLDRAEKRARELV
ncbi:transposase [Streptomyces sp. 549]|uniref:transposase n=1 Tax=Streptomyces sp. 549 TaxID=3049076 RepID=UPI0024C2C270|nr:transposase [Streptomyces sp. 549]MDK1473587.1 transposase [Streptomyces sp. 549]